MKISVIIPTYNRKDYVTEAIDSVLAQDYLPFEIIVVDDGSTDNTRQKLVRYSGKIRYFHQYNKGVSAARNTGLKAARGDYIALLDSDDLWDKSKLKKQAEFLKQNPHIGFLFTDMKESKAGRIFRNSWAKKMSYYKELKKTQAHVKSIVKFLYMKNCVPTSSVIFSRAAIKIVGFFNEELKIGEDREYWIRLACNFMSAYIDLPLTTKREHDKNMVKNVKLMLSSRLKFFNTIENPKGAFAPSNIEELKQIAIDETYFEYAKYYFKKLNFKHSFEYLQKLPHTFNGQYFSTIYTITRILKTVKG